MLLYPPTFYVQEILLTVSVFYMDLFYFKAKIPLIVQYFAQNHFLSPCPLEGTTELNFIYMKLLNPADSYRRIY